MASISASTRTDVGRDARPVTQSQSPARLGPWELVKRLGDGALATVYLARAIGASPAQPPGYALKVLKPEWQDDPRGRSLLAREVQVTRAVSNPHLVPMLGAQLDQAPCFLTMPFLEGSSLAEWLLTQPQLDLPMAFWFARQVAEALVALHTAGWMHGDIKPSNLLVSSTGHVTLIDLGFARQAQERNSIADRPVMGTLHYMAPEVVYSSTGGGVGSDVYSLGVVLFEMLTGRLPFDRDEVVELAAQHRQELPGDPRTWAPQIPTRAARLVQQMLSKEALRRPSARDLVNRLAMLEIETFAERFCLLE